MVFVGAAYSIKLSSKYTSTGSSAMFSDHLPKIDQTSGGNLFVIAAALVMVCQLVAMVVVTDGQVKKAEFRESRRLVLAQCLENVKGAARFTCTDRFYSDNRQASILSQVDDSTQDRSQSARRSTIEGLMAVSFAAR